MIAMAKTTMMVVVMIRTTMNIDHYDNEEHEKYDGHSDMDNAVAMACRAITMVTWAHSSTRLLLLAPLQSLCFVAR